MSASDAASGSGFDRAAVVVCRCEEVLAGEVAAAIASGATTVNDVKRWTRAGMGACQGIYCVPAIAVVVGAATGTAVEHIAPMTARAPARPIRLAALADLAEAGRDDNRFQMIREDGS